MEGFVGKALLVFLVLSVSLFPAGIIDGLRSGKIVLSSPIPATVNLLDFGADPTGVNDSSAGIQRWVDYCRMNNKLAYAPAGIYLHKSPINWGAWEGISVTGDGPGSAGVAGTIAQTRFLASFSTAQVAHDFSGSSYGKIANIAFDYDTGATQPTALILNARGSGGYASDIVWENCNWASGSICGALNHMAEVLTWRDCRGHAGGVPSLVITTDGDAWGVTSPFGYTFTDVFSCTVFRFFGGDFTGDNVSNIVFDYTGTDYAEAVIVHGTYFAISGSNAAAMEFNGVWANVHIVGVRVENDSASGSNDYFLTSKASMSGTIEGSYFQLSGSTAGATTMDINIANLSITNQINSTNTTTIFTGP